MVQLGQAKKEELENINRNEMVAECAAKERKKERCSFLDQIAQVRLKSLQKKDLIKYCINADEPTITALFDRLDTNNEQTEFL